MEFDIMQCSRGQGIRLPKVRGDWEPFENPDQQLAYYRRWGLIPPKSTTLRPVFVTDGYLGACYPCQVVGRQGADWAVVALADGCHAIYGEYLAEQQPAASQCRALPRGVSFGEVLDHYIVLDIETTGFDRVQDRILEIAANEYRCGVVVNRFHTFVDPQRPIPQAITQLTGITPMDVMGAPTIEEVTAAFLAFIGTLPIVGHNVAAFDLQFLSTQMEVDIGNLAIDTVPMARAAFPELANHKLSDLKTTLGLSEEVSHRADTDVETTNALLWACVNPRRYEAAYMTAMLDARLAGRKKRGRKK